MTDPLSGRDLEIAVARAMGWTANGDDSDRGLWRLYQQSRRIPGPYWWPSAEEAWEKDSPRYLTDPVAFASVLAALRELNLSWEMYCGQHYSSAQIGAGEYARDGRGKGATYQEAMCRAFVAWKQ